MVDDRASEHPCIEERVAQDRRALTRCAVVREPHDAGVGQLAERGELLAGPPGGHRPDDEDLDRRSGCCAPRHERSRATLAPSIAGEVFGMRQTRVKPPCAAAAEPVATVSASSKPGLAEVRVQIDEAGRDDDCRRVRPHRPPAPSSQVDRLHDPVADDDLARPLASGRRVDEPRPADLEVRDEAPISPTV